MAALTAAAIQETRPRGRSSYKMASSDTIYAGSLVSLDTSGYLIPHDDGTSTDMFIGIALETVTAGSGENPEVRVNEEGPILLSVDVGSTTVANTGALVYGATDNIEDIALSGTNAIGRIVRFHSGDDCDVELFTPAEALLI